MILQVVVVVVLTKIVLFLNSYFLMFFLCSSLLEVKIEGPGLKIGESLDTEDPVVLYILNLL